MADVTIQVQPRGYKPSPLEGQVQSSMMVTSSSRLPKVSHSNVVVSPTGEEDCIAAKGETRNGGSESCGGVSSVEGVRKYVVSSPEAVWLRRYLELEPGDHNPKGIDIDIDINIDGIRCLKPASSSCQSSISVTRLSGGLTNHTFRVASALSGGPCVCVTADSVSDESRKVDEASTIRSHGVLKKNKNKQQAKPVKAAIVKCLPARLAGMDERVVTLALPVQRGYSEFVALRLVPTAFPSAKSFERSSTRPIRSMRVQTPRAIHYDASARVLSTADVGSPSTRTLKDYLFELFANAEIPGKAPDPGFSLGRQKSQNKARGDGTAAAVAGLALEDLPDVAGALGRWLAELHAWGASRAAKPLRRALGPGAGMAGGATEFMFERLASEAEARDEKSSSEQHEAADQRTGRSGSLWRAVQTHVRSLFDAGNSNPGEAAGEGYTAAHVVHGDFWPGNVLVGPDACGIVDGDGKEDSTRTCRGGDGLVLTIIDWEAASTCNIPWNDVGQMAGEMVVGELIGRSKSPLASSTTTLGEQHLSPIVSAFLRAYLQRRPLSRAESRMTIISFGAQLAVWPALSGEADAQTVETLRAMGCEYVERAWSTDWEWLGREGSLVREITQELEVNESL